MVRRMERAHDRELRDVRERLLLMAGRVELMIADAIRALIERDPDLALRTHSGGPHGESGGAGDRRTVYAHHGAIVS